ncbi:hypothetical protein K492DRAFT_230894 [Lichtheimia hyalospora FSU 10163]|nr:hypothetical protein K492DRAFT_230894 [Lichtheimia hyalospora FSU 10163]
MGKHKKAGRSLLESFMYSNGDNGDIGEEEQVPLPDSMRASTLLEQIGKERSWTDDQIDRDIDILEHNRLYFVRDLRALSNHSWTVIDLLPLVRDLLRTAIDPDWERRYYKIKDKEKKKKYKKDKKKKYKKNDFSSNTMQLGEPVIADDDRQESDSSSSSSSSSSCDNHDEKQQKSSETSSAAAFTGRPIKAVSSSRIHVRTTAGKIYECDRRCPHKGVDLATWGQVLGNKVICTKHNWQFDLDGSGLGSKGRTLHPCSVNDW